MPLLFVRHAVAADRHDWMADDEHRPLRKRGRRQAEALVPILAGFDVERVLSSPFVRCVETVIPLAAARGCPVEETTDLAERSTHDAVALVRSLAGRNAVLCSHGDVIPRVLEHLVVHDGLDLGHDPRWAKASTWVLEDDGERVVKAFYLEPPD
ncbi:MAG: 8-oxo-(d)GTP phosphatase [Actinomycetota bacterium]|jgi:8-oxo-dGTP diphosphatase